MSSSVEPLSEYINSYYAGMRNRNSPGCRVQPMIEFKKCDLYQDDIEDIDHPYEIIFECIPMNWSANYIIDEERYLKTGDITKLYYSANTIQDREDPPEYL
jgi:hypothetical protein